MRNKIKKQEFIEGKGHHQNPNASEQTERHVDGRHTTPGMPKPVEGRMIIPVLNARPGRPNFVGEVEETLQDCLCSVSPA